MNSEVLSIVISIIAALISGAGIGITAYKLIKSTNDKTAYAIAMELMKDQFIKDTINKAVEVIAKEIYDSDGEKKLEWAWLGVIKYLSSYLLQEYSKSISSVFDSKSEEVFKLFDQYKITDIDAADKVAETILKLSGFDNAMIASKVKMKISELSTK